MCDTLLSKFGESCYMSANLLVTNTVYFNTWNQHEAANLINYLRYLGIFIVGFLPLHYLLFKSRFSSKNNYININFKLGILFLYYIYHQ